MPKMMYEHSEKQEEQFRKIKKLGVLTDADVSNKTKIIDFALESLSSLIDKQGIDLIIKKISNK